MTGSPRIDLHTHSAISDGTDTPAALVRAAHEQGLDVVALTDHDTTAGWAEAERTAREVGIELVRGLEISTKHRGTGVHLLAYLPDPTYPPLADRLARIIDGRGDRLPAMLAALARIGIDLHPDDVHAPLDGPVGRPHVADALVAKGVVADRGEAFDRYLSNGRPAYVDRYAPQVTEMVPIVAAAGGVTVVAHAWGRHGPQGLTEADIATLADLGLAGLEVDHHDHDAFARRSLLAIARSLDLVVTGSSDYHGTGKVDHDLGSHTTAPDEYARLLERAAAAASASGRNAPPVVEV